MFTKEEAYNQISSLVQRFNEQLPSYKKSDYNETQTRLDFINPFFKALGWDVDNSVGNAEAYREVIHEDKLKIGGATKAPDYSFRLPGGKRLFFCRSQKAKRIGERRCSTRLPVPSLRMERQIAHQPDYRF